MQDINTTCLTYLLEDDLTLVACPAHSHKNALVQHSFFSSFLLELLLFSKVFLVDPSVRRFN